jgi:heme oxygenase (mycobilin-producing)
MCGRGSRVFRIPHRHVRCPRHEKRYVSTLGDSAELEVQDMSIVVINAVTVAEEGRADFEERFAARAGTVSKAPGFEAFELLRPTQDGRYLVYTRWASEEDFGAWMKSAQFSDAHRQHADRGPVSAESEVWRFEVLESEYGSA